MTLLTSLFMLLDLTFTGTPHRLYVSKKVATYK